jgi:Leu/Phe-tRNA-protein transferase
MSTVLTFILAFVLFLGGMYLFGFAFSIDAWQAPVFVGGILAVSLAIAIPAHLMGRTE